MGAEFLGSCSSGASTSPHTAMTVLLLTGACGSGKSTVARLVGRERGWVHISEDEVWERTFRKDRGPLGTDEHRRKRQEVHRMVFEQIAAHIQSGRRVVIDATVHESPPESYREYEAFFRDNQIEWTLRVLHPRVDVAIRRDRLRMGWHAGEDGVRRLHSKFTFKVFPGECFIDTSDQTPEETARLLVDTFGVQGHSHQRPL